MPEPPEKAKPILPQDRRREPVIKPPQPSSLDSVTSTNHEQTEKNSSSSLEERPIRSDTDKPNIPAQAHSTRSGGQSSSQSSTNRTSYPQQYRHGVRVKANSAEVTELADGNGDVPEEEKQAIDQAGTQAVLEFEIKAGREPKDMNEEQPSHPGYDIESKDLKTGEVRYIEVKSLKGEWGRRGVCVTRTQFVTGDEHRANFWLYVVECATSEPKIHRIQNPVGLVGEFYYDDSWQLLEDSKS